MTDANKLRRYTMNAFVNITIISLQKIYAFDRKNNAQNIGNNTRMLLWQGSRMGGGAYYYYYYYYSYLSLIQI